MKKKLQRLFCVLMAACMAATLAPAALAASDLDGHWGQATMQEFIDRGWLTGYGDGQYGPDNGMTRAEFSALINRVTGLIEESETISNYTDVASGAWYASDLAKALAAGYMTGTSATTMSPNATITREQAMTMVTRLLGLTAADTEVEALARFSDASQISNYAQNPIAAMVAAGYVNGTTDGRLVPQKQLTRAEGITILYNALDALTAPAIPETGMVYGTATLTFAEYYAGDVSSVDSYGLDGITSATVDKHVSFNNGMYTNYTEDKTDGYNILGVKNVNVAVDAADYPAYVALNPTFKVSRSVPAQYKTVTIVDGKAVYSATDFNVVDTVTDATATLKTGSTWGDYEIDVTEHSTAYIRNSRSDEGFAINAYIQGTILETESGLKVGMEFLQSMWVQPWEISFNVSPESTLNAHIAGWDNLDELSKLVGEKVTKIIFVMPDSTYIYEFDGIYIKPVYPEQADTAASFTEGSADVVISGVPKDLEDVTVTITCGSGRDAITVANAVEIKDGKITMDSAYDDTQTYTVKVSSSNYADLVAAVPVNSTQVTQLTQLVEQAKALIDAGTAANDSGLIEHYEEAQALLADAGSATSAEAADLISELTEHLSVYITP